MADRLGRFQYLTPRVIDLRAVTAMDGPTAEGQEQCDPVPGPPRLPTPNQSGAGSEYVRLQFPPWLAKLGTDSFDFYASDFEMALPGVVGQSVSSAVLRFRVPDGMVGYLQNASLYILNPLATVKASWNIRINQGPVPGFSTLRNPPATANVMYRQFSDMAIRLPQGSTVDMLITDLAGVAATVGGELGGWYQSATAEAAAWGPHV